MGVAYLIRHAEPEVSGVLLGRTDVALGSCAINAAPFAVANVFTSPLRRALESAELLFPNHSISVIGALAERDLGDWDGRTWDEVKKFWPELAVRAETDWFGTVPPNGESWECFRRRVDSAWSVLRCAEAPFAVVAHAGVHAVLAGLIAGHDPAVFRQEYLEVLTLEFES